MLVLWQGADEVTGLHLIEACNGDVAMAIGMHMDTVGTAAAVSDTEPIDYQAAPDGLPSFSRQSQV